MTMIVHDVQQGTQEWHALRADHFTASEAPAMMGVSPYLSRDELLKQKALRLVDAEIDGHKAALFQAGHDAEAGYRPIAEAQIDDDLYNITGTRDVDGLPLLASFDGLTMDRTTGFEHKLWSGKAAAQLADAGEPAPHHYWQLEQQLLVSGAQRILFATSDGTAERSAWVWYESKPERRAQLIAGWKQFAYDLAAWVPPEAASAPAVKKVVANLPVVFDMRVEGKLVSCNLEQYKPAALAYIAAINTELATDQDFADADADAKFCRDSADKLELAIEQAMGQMGDINTALNTVREIAAAFDAKGLALEKLVKAQKDNIKLAEVQRGQKELAEHIATLNAAMPAAYMPSVPADFGAAVKNKRTVDSLRSAVNDELARAKIAASEIANRIHANVKTLQASGLVVHDAAALVLKATDDLAAIIATRRAAEDARLAAIRAEEAEKLQREQLAKQAEQAQAEIAQATQTGTLSAPVAADLSALVTERSAEAVAAIDASQAISTAQRAAAAGPAVAPLRAAPAAAVPTTPPSLKLGTITERLGFALSADFLRTLGFEPAAKVGAHGVYHEAQFPHMLAALVRHIEGVQAKAAA